MIEASSSESDDDTFVTINTLSGRSSEKKNGSDSNRKPKVLEIRMASVDIQKVRPPAIPSHNSAPVSVASMLVALDRDGPRGKQRSVTRGKESKMPQMSRPQTMPTSKSNRKGDVAPVRRSNLKNAEPHDSGNTRDRRDPENQSLYAIEQMPETVY